MSQVEVYYSCDCWYLCRVEPMCIPVSHYCN